MILLKNPLFRQKSFKKCRPIHVQLAIYYADVEHVSKSFSFVYSYASLPYIFSKKIFFPHATWKVYVWLLVSFIISLDKTTCLKRIIKQSHSTACLLAALLLASLKACGSVLKAISHGNTLLVSNDLIPPLLHTLRIVFYKNYVHHICIVYLSLHLKGIL